MANKATQKLGNRQYDNRLSLFKREVCDTHCKLCAAKKPEFCMFLFESNYVNFFHNVLALLIIANARRPRLVETLKSFEGFVAIFCNKDVCNFKSNTCTTLQKIDCYQMFLNQSGQVLEEGEDDRLVNNWDAALYIELSDQLDELSYIFRTLKNKKRRKLFKILKRLRKIFIHSTKSEKRSKIVQSNINITTSLFYNENENWITEINEIMEGLSP